MTNNKLFEKLRIAFKYGIKVTKKHPESDDCDDIYFDRAIAVINKWFPSQQPSSTEKQLKEVLEEIKELQTENRRLINQLPCGDYHP